MANITDDHGKQQYKAYINEIINHPVPSLLKKPNQGHMDLLLFPRPHMEGGYLVSCTVAGLS